MGYVIILGMKKIVLRLGLGESLKLIYKKQRKLTLLMALLLAVNFLFLIFTLLNLKVGSQMVKVSYGDIGSYQGGEWSSMINSGGYHDGLWVNKISYVLLAVVFGLLHNLLAIRLFEKRGVGAAQVFVLFSISLTIAAFLVLGRLLGES